MLSDEAKSVLAAPVNVEVLPRFVDGELQGVGVRIRPYGRDYPKDIMVLGFGADFEAALEECYELAAAGRWEPLSYAARPWAADVAPSTGAFGPPAETRRGRSAAR